MKVIGSLPCFTGLVGSSRRVFWFSSILYGAIKLLNLKILIFLKKHLYPVIALLLFCVLYFLIKEWELHQTKKVLPLIHQIQSFLLFGGIGFSLSIGWGSIFYRSIWPWLKRAKRWTKISLSFFCLLLGFGLASISMLGTFETFFGNPNFALFDESFVSKKKSPDGKREAYVYKWGILCGYTIYIRERGSLLLDPYKRFAVRCEDQDKAILHWDENSQHLTLKRNDGSEIVPGSGDHLIFPVWH